jgi:prolyl-tRNA synthetase
MRWTQTHIVTIPEDPKECEIISHKLMIRAGLIRKLAGGLYTFMPLGYRALRKIENIVRDEMDNAGALEILMPALQPRELWEQSGRDKTMQDVIFKVVDRQNREIFLGPTHEEVITDLVSREIRSYKQLPCIFYQIQTKFRDEIRPRFGLMRAREFIMKDAYSFDINQESADISYQKMYRAYSNIFKRCGLSFKVVEADTGAMGGKWSHEFMVTAEAGEDAIIECPACSYAANVERAERAEPISVTEKNINLPSPSVVATPGLKSVVEVSQFLKCEPSQMIKTMIYIADGNPIAVLVNGDRDINEKKLARYLGASELLMADEKTIEQVTNAPVGFAGPVGLNIPVYADNWLRSLSAGVTGANKADAHLINVNLERDAKITAYGDFVVVRRSDPCPKCRTPLIESRGIEVGHLFKLGTKYSDAFDARYIDPEGNRKPIIMGCYGIGVTRTLQAVVEQCNDENGIIWPMSIAPYQVVILPFDTDRSNSKQVAEKLMEELTRANVDVLLDDRDETPGVKLKDADLIGFPIRIIVSRRSLSKNSVEIKSRAEKTASLISVNEAVGTVCKMISSAMNKLK